MRRSLLLATSALVASVLAGAAQAQDTSSTIEELVVTAEKREQSLQDVPVAISAYTSEKRDLIGINSVQDMTNFTPGLAYNNTSDRISLRGIGRVTNVQAADGAVAIYSDGIFTSSTFEASKQPLFIDRVEVLRGPQGTLYGRNSIGGAINVLSKRPSQEFEGEVRATLANYGMTILQSTVSGPLTEGLRYRLNAQWEKQQDGYFQNVVPGKPDEGRVVDQTYLEGQLAMDLGDRVEGWVKLSMFNWNNGGGGLGDRAGYTPFPYNTTQENSTNFYLNQGYGCSGFVTGVVNTASTGCTNPAIKDNRKFASDTASTVSLDETFTIATEFVFHMDQMDLKYIGGGSTYHYTLVQDNDGGAVSQYTVPLNPAGLCASLAALGCAPLTVFPKAVTTYEEDKHWWSHELNLASTSDGPLQWLLGAYYYHESYKQPVSVALPGQAQFATPNTLLNTPAARNPNRYWYDTRPDFQDESYAFFGQIDWQFTETLKLTAGLRYSKDHKFGQEEARLICFALVGCGTAPQNLGTFPPAIDITPVAVGSGKDASGKLLKGVQKATVFDPTTGLAKRELDAEWQATTGTIGIDWKPDNDTLAFAKYSRGYKAGGFNSGITSPVVDNPYTDAEHNDAFELGLKKTIGRNFQANLSLFYYNYENFQAPVTIVPTGGGIQTAQTVFFNVPKAISKGFEAELIWNPLQALRFTGTYSYTDAYIDEARGLIDPADPAALDKDAKKFGAPSTTLDIYSGKFQQGQDLSGDRLPQSAKNRVAVNGLYTWDYATGSLTASVSYIWRDEQYGTIFTRSYNRTPAWDQVDLRLTYKDSANRYSIIAYGKNILDQDGYYEGATSTRVVGRLPTGVPVVQGIATTYPLNPPRTYGVEFQYRF